MKHQDNGSVFKTTVNLYGSQMYKLDIQSPGTQEAMSSNRNERYQAYSTQIPGHLPHEMLYQSNTP